MRILFETDRIFKSPENNVGIPRVIRNVTSNLHLHGHKDVECIPIMSWRQVMYNASEMISVKKGNSPLDKIYFSLEQLLKKVSKLQWGVCSPEKSWRLGALLKVLLGAFAKTPICQCLKICRHLRIQSIIRKLPVVDVCPGDIVVWTGTWRDSKGQALLRLAKSNGARIVIVVYDLFQITRSEIMPGNTGITKVPEMMLLADGFLSISDSVNDEMQRYMQQRSDCFVNHVWRDYFYLGSELDLIDTESQTRASFKSIFQKRKPVYIMVGTICPHKNHEYAIDAFEQLWAKGVDVSLCFIGKMGWKCDKILHRITSHPQWQEHLFMVNDASDDELAFSYRNAKALIFPSLDEGFGLPLVEAMQYGLPVMASDIPVFREIGSDFVAFFDLSHATQLHDLVTEFESRGIFPADRPVTEWQWINWQESARQLIDKILLHESSKQSSSQ